MSSHDLVSRSERSSCAGVDWLLRNFKKGGHYGIKGLMAHYKTPLLFAEAGYTKEAETAFSWIMQSYTGPDWHTQDPEDTAAAGRHCDLYEDLWLAWGAMRAGRVREAYEIYGLCRGLQHPDHGGVSSRISRDTTAETVAHYDLRSTALAGLVGLAIGDDSAVASAAKFTLDIVTQQPDLARGFYLVRDEHARLVTSFPEKKSRIFMVGFAARQKHPLYYALGLGLTFLATLHRHNHDNAYLEGARFYARQCAERGDNLIRHHYAGKVCWGMALLHKITGSLEERFIADKCAEYLLDTQLDTGEWWLPTLFERQDHQPRSVTIDRTAEYALWLRLFSRSLTEQ